MYRIVELSDEFIQSQDTVDIYTLVGRQLDSSFVPVYDHYDESLMTHFVMIKIASE